MQLVRLSVFFFLLFLLVPLSVHAEETWPQDAQDVAFAVAARLTGQHGFDNIDFASGVDETMEGMADNFYHAFDAGKIVLIKYENYGTGANYEASLVGVINLQDKYGRLVALQFLALFEVEGGNIHVNQCMAASASPATLPVAVFLVPADAFRTKRPKEADTDWSALFEFAHASAFNPAKEEPQLRQYIVMSFFMTRLPDNAKLEALVGERKSVRRSKNNLAKQHQEYLSYDGWRVHMFSARFKPYSSTGRFYINYYYTPGSGVPEDMRDRTLVSQYDSNPPGGPTKVFAAQSGTPPAQPSASVKNEPTPAPKQVSPAQQQATPKPAPAPTPAPPAAKVAPTAAVPSTAVPVPAVEGPIAKGMAFLNPIFPDDVALIQQRLKDLGRYGGPIDKTFGPTTKRSLDNFASEYGFPKGQWSLGLQKELFKGSGL